MVAGGCGVLPGGRYKAIYSYAAEDYEHWRKIYRPELAYGAFGENLTVRGLDEAAVCIGDRYRIGEALLQVSEPRTPCRTLGMHFQDMSIVKKFYGVGRFGIYWQVFEPGTVQAGDAVTLVFKDPDGVPMREIIRLYAHDKQDAEGLDRILSVASLPPAWREVFEEQRVEITEPQGKLFAPESPESGRL